jgi:hypothetical protein
VRVEVVVPLPREALGGGTAVVVARGAHDMFIVDQGEQSLLRAQGL